VTSLFREYFNDLEIYRYGGDEFVFLSTRNVPETAKKLEKINLKLTISGSSYPIHISGGVTATSAEKAIADSIACADALLYKAKENGKGRIVAG
ncbi:MAG: diguanylate cyclase, partial [Lachnospiraceae bacterium]|nr:diguanylate cyclase [Lachnospiraceae bacterium]